MSSDVTSAADDIQEAGIKGAINGSNQSQGECLYSQYSERMLSYAWVYVHQKGYQRTEFFQHLILN